MRSSSSRAMPGPRSTIRSRSCFAVGARAHRHRLGRRRSGWRCRARWRARARAARRRRAAAAGPGRAGCRSRPAAPARVSTAARTTSSSEHQSRARLRARPPGAARGRAGCRPAATGVALSSAITEASSRALLRAERVRREPAGRGGDRRQRRAQVVRDRAQQRRLDDVAAPQRLGLDHLRLELVALARGGHAASRAPGRRGPEAPRARPRRCPRGTSTVPTR